MLRGEEGFFYFFLLLFSDASAPSESVLLQGLIRSNLFLRFPVFRLQPIQNIPRISTFFRVLGIIPESHPNCPVPICHLFFGEKIGIKWDYGRGEFSRTPAHT
jgi:hypothetical protein